MESRITQWISLVVITGGIVLLLVLAVFLVNREDATSLAASAETAMIADNALGVVTAVRSGSSSAFAYVTAAGVDAQVEGLLVDVTAATDELNLRIDRLAASVPGGEVLSQAEVFGKHTTEFVEAVVSDIGLAEEAMDGQAEAMEALVGTLVEIRDTEVQSVLIAGEDVGRAAQGVRFLILFVIPLAVIVSIWRIQRRLSERKLLATEVEKQKNIADSKDAFVADVSHELRTPLTGIYGFAMALEEHSSNFNDFQSELVGLIIGESAELSRMVDDLVALGRIDADAVTYTIEDVEVAAEVDQVVLPFRRMGISFEHDANGLTVRADSARFRQILRNLLSNAVKYGNGEVAVAAYGSTGVGVVEVIDAGPGVPDDVVARLFQRYVHSDGSAVVEGSVGLGLAIASSFADGMGGDLSYRRDNDLTIFRLELPRSDLGARLKTPI